ncbi:MAG: ATP-binding protein, partial [Myxococcota bacterium]
RRQVTEPRAVDLRDVLASLDRIVERVVGESITMKVVTTASLWTVRVDRGQIEQVIVNLIINARDAMPEGGRLVVRLTNTQVLAETPLFEGAKPGEYVELSVHDTGVGMSEEVKAHLFEPFFTTKDREQGTGLGLATCFGIVKQSEGYIWAESEVGEGTTVRVLLPRAQTADQKDAPLRADGELPRGTETIFVAEDEEKLRKLAVTVLRRLGYNVLEAENGEVAWNVAEARIDDIDLLLTDVAMPRVSGPELVRRLRTRRPELPVIFTSGYRSDALDLEAAAPDAVLLTKPFSPVILAHAIRRALDGKGRAAQGSSSSS